MSAMMTFYPDIKLVHVAAAMTSGTLFALRALGLLAGMRWPRAALVRYTSYTIDTFLLTSAAMLATLLPRALFANGWLTVKLVLVVVYIVLGVMAMRASLSRGARTGFYIAALAVFAFILGIARLHSPWGWLAPYLA